MSHRPATGRLQPVPIDQYPGADALAGIEFDTPSSRVSSHHPPYRTYDTSSGPAQVLLPDALARLYAIPALSTDAAPLRRCRDVGLLVPGAIEATGPLPLALPIRTLASLLQRRTAALPARPDAQSVYTHLVRFARDGDPAEVHSYFAHTLQRCRYYVEPFRGQYRALRGADADTWLATGEVPPERARRPRRVSPDAQRAYRSQRQERRYRGAVTVLEGYKAQLPAGTHLDFATLADVVADGCPDEPAFERLVMGHATDGAAGDVRRAADTVFGPRRLNASLGRHWAVY